MHHSEFLAFLMLCILCSDTALAGYGASQSTTEASMPTLGVQSGSAQYGSSDMAEYSTQAPPTFQQMSLQPLDTRLNSPTNVYFRGSEMSWSDYSGISSLSSPLFWASTSTGWSWYAVVPLGGWSRQIVYVPVPGVMKVYETYPSGATQEYDLGSASFGYSYLWFYADVPGRHTSIFTVDGVPSNAVITDVSSTAQVQQGYSSAATSSQASSAVTGTTSRYSFNSGLAVTYPTGAGTTSRYSLKASTRPSGGVTTSGRSTSGVTSIGYVPGGVTSGSSTSAAASSGGANY
jgi:hypothetical protein